MSARPSAHPLDPRLAHDTDTNIYIRRMAGATTKMLLNLKEKDTAICVLSCQLMLMRLVLWMLSVLLRIFGAIGAVPHCYWYIGVVR